MKRKKRYLRVTALLLAMLMLSPLFCKETYLGASSYDNAKMFYESTGSSGSHAETKNAQFYFATII